MSTFVMSDLFAPHKSVEYGKTAGTCTFSKQGYVDDALQQSRYFQQCAPRSRPTVGWGLRKRLQLLRNSTILGFTSSGFS